jgi:GNAT superfamily N-acetyltransferase
LKKVALDLHQVVLQIGSLVTRLREGRQERGRRLALARETLERASADITALQRRIAAARTSWLVAGVEEGLGAVFSPPPAPPSFAVVAVDGSHLSSDRHSPARCYLINIGVAHIQYGESPAARLASRPSLYAEDADMAIPDPARVRDEPVQGEVLGLRRTVAEAEALSGLVEAVEPALPILGLLDGSLILWGVAAQGFPAFVREALLERGFLPAVERIRRVAEGRPLALASYISHPAGTDVVNALRIAMCPFDTADCDKHCRGRDKECAGMDGVDDRMLFEGLLSPGERSPVFATASSVVRQYYGEHEVFFFYIKTEEEIARVEVPRWVARDPARLGLAHSLVVDSCRRGRGYPVGLMEAHQLAVLTAAHREQFWGLVARELEAGGLPAPTSAKAMSKRIPWV